METMQRRFEWPDPWNPVFVTRDFTLIQDGEEPMSVQGMRLIQLVADCLYEVPDSGSAEETTRGLRHGCILSRNLRLTERFTGGDLSEQAKQCFVSYDGVYKARRGLGRADQRGNAREIPDLRTWTGSLEELLRMSWKLRKDGSGDQTRFVLTAAVAAEDHRRVIDRTKIEALARTLQAGSMLDKRGRFNPGRIPLICFAGQRQLAMRIQAVRGIGRHMSFREVVLEHYIDRLSEICRDVMRSQEYRLRSDWLAENNKRTPQKVRVEAQRFEDAARRLRQIKIRPFCRSFTRASDDMNEAAKILREAAENRDVDKIANSKVVIGRVYRSMRMLEQHWRLEELMVQCANVLDHGSDLSYARRRMWHSELCGVHRVLTHVDKITRQKLENGFVNPVLHRVVPHVYLADASLMRSQADGGTDLRTMYAELRIACSPM